MVDARIDSARLQYLAREAGLDLARRTIELADPGEHLRGNTRRGDFGEVMHTAVLEEFDGYSVPVRKLRHKMRRTDQLTGIDVVAVKVDEQRRLSEVLFVECKYRSLAATTIAATAHDQLTEAYTNDADDSLDLIHSELYKRDDALLGEFTRYLTARTDLGIDGFCIGLCVDPATWTDDTLQDLFDHPSTLAPLRLEIVKLDSLSSTVTRTFDAIGPQLLS